MYVSFFEKVSWFSVQSLNSYNKYKIIISQSVKFIYVRGSKVKNNLTESFSLQISNQAYFYLHDCKHSEPDT